MSVARPSDGLLPAKSTIQLVQLLAERSLPVETEQLLRDLAAITQISGSRGRNTLAKLMSYGVFRPAGADSVIVGTTTAADWKTAIAQHIASELASALNRSSSWSCLRLEQAADLIMIDSMLLPSFPDGLGMWVIDFGVAEREMISSRHWTVAADYKSALLNAASDANHKTPPRSKSAERLAAELARQAENGAAAEDWVVAFEHRRLHGHPLLKQVRRISIDDVSAGYDILSFTSTASLRHDLFIEVKSYVAAKTFHWSRNEIATARDFGEAYALYLVDRTRCVEVDYHPHIITGPSPEIFKLPGSGWRVEATSFEHIAVSDN